MEADMRMDYNTMPAIKIKTGTASIHSGIGSPEASITRFGCAVGGFGMLWGVCWFMIG